MAIGALKRWMIYGGFDGFRFDLATRSVAALAASTRMRRFSKLLPKTQFCNERV